MNLTDVIIFISSGILLVLIWIYSLRFLACSGGWQKLSEAYPAREQVNSHKWVRQSATFGDHVNYTRLLTLSVNQNGVQFEVTPPFHFGHAPVFVPWADMSFSEAPKPLRYPVLLRFERTPEISCRIPKELAARLQATSHCR
ncbi:MAG: hypothetical protein AB4426_06240 [Xenococcaceae cyanobacterium]